MSKVTQVVNSLAEPVVKELGLELWDVEYVREAGQWFLRIYIDKDGGVDINDCVAVSQAMDPLLDEADPVPDSYVFEVCSAGADRELKRPSDFERFMGSRVEIKLYRPIDGRKAVVGTLCGYQDGNITIQDSENTITFEKAQVAQVRLYIDFG